MRGGGGDDSGELGDFPREIGKEIKARPCEASTAEEWLVRQRKAP